MNENKPEERKEKKGLDSNLIAGAIVLAGVLIAAAIFGTKAPTQENVATPDAPAAGEDAALVRNISADDHVLGSPNAEIVFIEYSDFECPFCANVHPTLERIVEENNDVAWVYRHFPLSGIHPQATPAAIASECVAELGGNDAFWRFSDTLFANQDQLSEDYYLQVAQGLGISSADFQRCIANPATAEKVSEDAIEARDAGAEGTPFTVVITASGEQLPIGGALPYENWQQVLETARDN